MLELQNAPPEEEVYTSDSFFDDDELARIKDMKIIAQRERAEWQQASSEH